VVRLADLEQRVGAPARFGPPAVQVFTQGATADEAGATVFAEVFDADNGRHLNRIHKGPFDMVKEQDADKQDQADQGGGVE